MRGEHLTRRTILAAAVAAVALSSLLGAPTARAAEAQKIPDYKDADDFADTCELLGGDYSVDGIGNSDCDYEDGGWTQCDENGHDCWYTPPRLRPGGLDGMVTAPLDQVSADPGGDDDEQASSPDEDEKKDKQRKKGKHHQRGRGGKARKR